MLDTTREHLVWPGTAVGGSGVRPLFIKNTSATESMSLALDMADGSFFKFETVPKPSSSFEIAMAPRTERNVNVLFAPTDAVTYRDSVVIRSISQQFNLASTVIPLSGYGGSSDVQIHVNARDGGGRPCLSLSAAAADGSRLASFSIANTGRRAAYIRLLLFTDTGCSRPLAPQLASVRPAEFVLRPGESRPVTAAAPPGPAAADVGAVLVLSGDELLRRELRRCPPAAAAGPRGPAGLHTGLFQAVFEGEHSEGTEEMSLGIPASKVEELFFANMKQTKLPLKHMELRLPAPAAAPHGQALPAGAAPPRKTEYSGPGQAIIQEHVPRQTVPLELTKRGPSPAGGGARLAAPAAARAQPALDTGWWPQPPGVEQLVADNGQAKLRLSTNHLMFPRTPLGVPRSLTLQLTNLGDDVLKWNIFGYSVPYLVTGVETMVKCGYDVFKMRPQDGLVKPGQTLTLHVTFSPPYPGQLTQLFQMLCKPAKELPGMPMVVYTLPVRVSGRGSVLDEGEDESDLLTSPLHVSEDYLFFRHLSVCHKLEITNKMREDLDVEYCVSGPFKVVAGPNEHSLTDLTEGHMTAPSQRYVQMSVYFCPELAGAFSGQLRLWLNGSGWRHLVRLEGTCEDADAVLQPLVSADG